MEKHERKVAIIGGGIAGLCTAVYAAKCGYKPEVFEMHECLGGLATSWRRGDYTFETCLHWLLGSRPGSPIYDKWKEVFDIDRLTFVHHEEFARIEDATGDVLRIYSDIGLLEAELLSRAPKDASAIHHFTETIRRLVSFELPDSSEGWMK
ncbi:MAG TPA: FAD-dependent oxidoreductase, partial [Bryobacteraceae bacterium]